MYKIKDTRIFLVGAYCMWDRKAILIGEEMGRVSSLLDFEEVIRTRVLFIIRDTGFCKKFPLCSELCWCVI